MSGGHPCSLGSGRGGRRHCWGSGAWRANHCRQTHSKTCPGQVQSWKTNQRYLYIGIPTVINRHTQTQTDRHPPTQTDTPTQRHTHTDTPTHTQTDTPTQTDRHPHRQTRPHRDIPTPTQTPRYIQTHTHRSAPKSEKFQSDVQFHFTSTHYILT